MIGLVHLFVSTESELEFAYKSPEGIVFDWTSFEKQLNMEFIKSTLDRALKQYKINSA